MTSFCSGSSVNLTCCLSSFLDILQYVSKSASTIRAALKEPAKRKAAAQETFTYKTATWENGVQGPKTVVSKVAIID